MTFEWKARWVKYGHSTTEPENSAYNVVVSRESVRIDLTYASLNGLYLYVCDIHNSYLQIPSSQKYFIICGPEFGIENVGKKALIIRSLYGVKHSGADYWRHVQSPMDKMGFEYWKSDPDIWFCSAVKDGGTDYYQYVLLYTNNIQAIMQNLEYFIRHELGKICVVKPKYIGPPTQEIILCIITSRSWRYR